MIKTLKTQCLVLAIACTATSALPAQAASYVFSDSLSPSFADQAVATLTISDIAGGTLWSLTGTYDARSYPSAFLQGIAYTYSDGSGGGKGKPGLAASDFTVTQGAVTLKGVDAKGVTFSTANNSGRFQSGDAVTWVFRNTTASQFSDLQAHVNAINGGNSVKFAAVAATTPLSPIPEPGTWAMLLTGLAFVAWRGRRLVATAPSAPALAA
ncbi:hypothetical protein NCCP691_25400 [Noviherbaspirillum aridicola]|uniref:Ice-binding protein C-terminal domain-containing protein n=2 Tax=Noviherbaspirillum aridicola TaxID=2849687 RepID=A0ABQ4Q672_9BURK|nr:hypothetical protein NCCP691_25400 [Noviherbaspirillum aridicola]